MDEEREARLLDWGIAARPMPGEAESGDRALVVVDTDSALVAAIDGLGHGREAARAAAPAIETMRRFAGDSLVSLAEQCHEALRGGRGAALTLARFCARDNTVAWLGIGNVEARLVRTDGSGAVCVDELVSAAGIAGDYLPKLKEVTLPVRRGDVVLIATDGIDSAFADSLRPHGTAEQLAARILEESSNPKDDALVVVARYMGRSH
jgi:negative regulator of sigma-B (phosphoserine phosphatase)